MASAILHIKDAYYFDVPKTLLRSNLKTRADFPDVWIRLDDEYQDWQVGQLYATLAKMPAAADVPTLETLRQQYTAFKHHDHHNVGKPLVRFLKDAPEAAWFREKMESADWVSENGKWIGDWEAALEATAKVEEYLSETPEWSSTKIQGYNEALAGKILIPQPFGGRLRNLYEAESGFCLSKFMIIELVVALIVAGLFIWLGSRVRTGERPRGRLWNFLETFVVFIRDQMARPAIGHGADRFVPILCTLFFFVLGCNLMGMLPWVGSPTAEWGVTLALAVVTFSTVVVSGSAKFGPVGFWLNQVPSMELSWPIALVIKPMLFVIEVAGLCIKHTVLSIRLLPRLLSRITKSPSHL